MAPDQYIVGSVIKIIDQRDFSKNKLRFKILIFLQKSSSIFLYTR